MKDEKSILIIGEISSFLGKAMQTNLENAGYCTAFVNPNITEISEQKDQASLVLLYLGEYIEEATKSLVYIRDFCMEDNKELFLVGYEGEIEAAEQIIPEHMVIRTFGRPLNVKELVEQLNIVVEKRANMPKKKHILVVDDSGQMLRAIRSWLIDEYEVSMANSGMGAITFLAKTKPDLILLDYEMPVCSGPQVLEMIRNEAATREIPVIFLTAKSDRDSVMKVLSLKPEGYLLKTKTPDEIKESIAAFFATRKVQELQNPGE